MTTTYKPLALPVLQLLTNSGSVALAGGKLFTYQAGTSTKQATYSDAVGTLNANPIILDGNGRCTVFLQVGLAYKLVLAPANDTDPPTSPIWSPDNIAAGDELDLTPFITVTSNNLTLSASSGILALVNPVLEDTNGIKTLIFNAGSGSPVNYTTITPTATTLPPVIQAAGSDTNISEAVRGKGTGGAISGTPSGTIPAIWEPGSTTNTISHSVPVITAPRTVTWPDSNVTIQPHGILQRVVVTNTAALANTTTNYATNAVPTTAAGTTVLTTSFTPVSASSKIAIKLFVNGSATTTGQNFVLALFNTTASANAIDAWVSESDATDSMHQVAVHHELSSPGTSAITLQAMFAADSGNSYVNRISGTAAFFGGSLMSSNMEIIEYI